MVDARHAWVVVAIPLLSCGERTIDPLDRECVRARILPFSPDRITRSGRTLFELSDWSIEQIEPDGSLTTVVQLDVDLDPASYYGAIEHDPVSGRMWLLAASRNDLPAWLFQFDAAGQVEWADELSDLGGEVNGGGLLHHEGALIVTIGTETPPWEREVIVERRDLSGAVVWSRGDLPTPDDDSVFASANPIGVVDGVLALIATPPLIDYGPSFPLTLDFATGETIWSGADGHDPIRMAVDDERLYLAHTGGPRFDSERFPSELIELEPATSTLEAVSPSGEVIMQDQVEWPQGWRGHDDDEIALVRLGDRLISLVQGSEALGVTVHDRAGELECQGKLDLDIDRVGWGITLEGRAQGLAWVTVRTGEFDEYGEPERVHAMLLIEPL
ncbi:MAG TPA: hypothetical protein VM869_33280 [Enhygromyxa sp.]|nr:hypothetical protein [Enhygromyxa sp.]